MLFIVSIAAVGCHDKCIVGVSNGATTYLDEHERDGFIAKKFSSSILNLKLQDLQLL